MINNFNVLFINCNVQEFIHIAIKSLLKFHPHCNIYVFDNSNNGTKFENIYDNVTVFDNTNGQIINVKNKLGSKQHALSIQKCFELINDNFVLCDTDIIFIKNIDDLIDNNYLCCGQIQQKTKIINNKSIKLHDRLFPDLCYINVKLCNKYNINYCIDERIGVNKTYDTGASFLEDVLNCDYENKVKNINIKLLRIHFGAGTRYNTPKYNKQKRFDEWIKKYG